VKAKIFYLIVALVLATGLAVAAVPSASVSAFTSINIYVDDDFPDTQEYHDLHMWTTIQEGINDARDGVEGVGDTVYLYAGTYNENVVVNKEILTIHGESSSKVTVDGQNSGYTIDITSDDVKVRQLKIVGGNPAGVRWGDVAKGYLEKCDITNNAIGVLLNSLLNQTIVCNRIHDNTGDGMKVVNSQLKDLTLNTIYSNRDGISLYNSSKITIWYNESYSNSRYGIYVDSASYSNDIYPNDFYNNGVADGYSARAVAEYNEWYTGRSYCYNSVFYPSGSLGNYWGDYGGSDGGGDGIGDTPHPLGNEQDDYPLMSSYVNYPSTCGGSVPSCTPEVAPPSPPATPSPCFIATAAYGTSTAAEIDTLRAFRDEVMLQNSLGSQLVALYYEVSPPVADFISEHEGLRTLVRELLVDPVTWLVEATGTLWRD